MITTKTVLVLGAGASEPYGFPIGSKLVRDMRDYAGLANSENWCRSFLEWLQRNAGDEAASWSGIGHDMKPLCRELGVCRTCSIDEFLERREDMVNAGRLVISICLLMAEGRSKSQLWSDATEGHWYDYLKSQLINRPKELGQDELRVITFNYERSLEHFLYWSLKPYYSQAMTDEEYTAAIKQFRFLHIYGSLGPLPWQSATGAVDYGAQGYGEILAAAKGIRVLHQGTQDTVQQNLKQAQEWLKWADRVLFLGFGFHKDNVERIALAGTLRSKQKISGTCCGLDYTNRNRVEYCTEWAVSPEQSRGGVPVKCAIRFPDKDAKCYKFLHDDADLS